MSTRSIVAFETEVGIRGVYVHYDGYPDGRLPVLKKMINRDGAAKVTATILAIPAWASLDNDQSLDSNPFVIEGYGRRFNPEDKDDYFTPNQLQEWWDSEYVYVIHPETGAIRWAAIGVGHEGQSWEALEWNSELAA